MILSAADALAAWPFVARRFGRTTEPDEVAVRAALDAARMLASGDVAGEAAAVFYAFASYRRAFPGAWAAMAALLARAQARVIGQVIRASGPDLDALALDVMHKRADFDHVRAWFADRLEPIAEG